METNSEKTNQNELFGKPVVSIKKCKESNSSSVYSILLANGDIVYLKLEERAYYYDSQEMESHDFPKNFSGITLKCKPEHQYLSFLLLDSLLNFFNQKFVLPLRLIATPIFYLPFSLFESILIKHAIINSEEEYKEHVLLSRKVDAVSITKAHLERYAQVFAIWCSLLHCIGVEDIKPEHFLIDEEKGVVYLLDYGLTQSLHKIKNVLKSIRSEENLIDYPEFDESPEDVKSAFIHLKTNNFHKSSLTFIFHALLNKSFHQYFHQKNKHIVRSEAIKFLQGTLNHVVCLTGKLNKNAFIPQGDLINLFPKRILPIFLPFIKPVFYKETNFIFWKGNLNYPMNRSLLSRGDVSELHVYTSYWLKTLGDVEGALKIALDAQKTRVDLMLTLFIAIDENKSDADYLTAFLNSGHFREKIQIRVFVATRSESCRSAFLQSKNQHIIFFEHDPYKLIEKLALKSKSFCYVPSYNKKVTSRRHLPDILFTKKIIETGINSSGGVFPIEPFSDPVFKHFNLKLPQEGLLFGGYLNKSLSSVLEEQKKAMPDYIKNYFMSCLLLAQQHYAQNEYLNKQKIVSFVINLNFLKVCENEIWLTQDRIKQPISLSLNEDEIKKLGISKVSIITAHYQADYELSHEEGIHLQILNYFPLSPEEFQVFLHCLSQQLYPYFLVTMGTLSIIEAVFYKKIILFPQIMNWETGFWEAYKEKFRHHTILKKYFDFFDGPFINDSFENAQWIADMIFNVENRKSCEEIHQNIIANTPSLLKTINTYLENLIPSQKIEDPLLTNSQLMF